MCPHNRLRSTCAECLTADQLAARELFCKGCRRRPCRRRPPRRQTAAAQELEPACRQLGCMPVVGPLLGDMAKLGLLLDRRGKSVLA